MAPAKRPKPKPKKPRSKPVPKRTAGAQVRRAAADSFPAVFAALLRARKIPVPKGLEQAPPAAYANEPVEFVERLKDLEDAQLVRYAERVASFSARQTARAQAEWDASPLIAELRRRGLAEPERPERVFGVSVSLKKPLQEWSDDEIVSAARAWSERARA